MFMDLQTKKDNFELKELKLKNSGGVEVTFRGSYEHQQTYRDGLIVKSERIPHPDLRKAMDKLAEHVARIYGLSVKDTENNLTGDLATKEVEVFKVAISGEDDNRGVVISAKIEGFSNKKMALNTPRIVFNNDEYGYETKVEKLVDKIEAEAYAYVIERKSAQLELDLPGEEDEDEGEPVEAEKREMAAV